MRRVAFHRDQDVQVQLQFFNREKQGAALLDMSHFPCIILRHYPYPRPRFVALCLPSCVVDLFHLAVVDSFHLANVDSIYSANITLSKVCTIDFAHLTSITHLFFLRV